MSLEKPDRKAAKEEHGVDRREFLAGTVAVGAYAAMPAAAKAESTAPSEMSVAERADLFQKGLVELRLAARSAPYEKVRIFVDDGKKAEWDSFPDGNGSWVLTPMEPLREKLASKETHISHFHTHPSAAVAQDISRTGVSTERAPLYTMPPSFQDFTLVMNLRDQYKENFERLTFHTVDTQGTWEYGVDFSHPEVQELLQEQKVTAEIAQQAFSNPEVMHFMEQHAGEDMRSVYAMMLDEEEKGTFSSEASKGVRALRESVKHSSEENPLVKDIMDTELREGSFEPSPEAVARRIEEYAKHGLKLSFTRFP